MAFGSVVAFAASVLLVVEKVLAVTYGAEYALVALGAVAFAAV